MDLGFWVWGFACPVALEDGPSGGGGLWASWAVMVPPVGWWRITGGQCRWRGRVTAVVRKGGVVWRAERAAGGGGRPATAGWLSAVLCVLGRNKEEERTRRKKNRDGSSSIVANCSRRTRAEQWHPITQDDY